MKVVVQKYLLKVDSVAGTVLGTRNTAQSPVSGLVRELPRRGVRRQAEWTGKWMGGKLIDGRTISE